MKRYLICLAGSSDTELRLVHPAAEGWINKATIPANGTELIPLKLYEGEDVLRADRRVIVTEGSPDNDRALACPGQTFDDSKALAHYLKRNRVELTGVYVGMIY